jgi:hypothetical protein
MLAINTEHLSIDAAVDAISVAFGKFRQKKPCMSPDYQGFLKYP